MIRLDLDRRWTRCQWTRWTEELAEILEHVGVQIQAARVYHTRHGFHVELEPRPETCPVEHVVALQAILGSDRRREAHNLRRLIERGTGSIDDWNVFFERKRHDDGRETTRTLRTDATRVLERVLHEHGHRTVMREG